MSAEETNGTVAEIFPKLCSVRMDEGGQRVLCAYRRNSVFGLRLNPPPFDQVEDWRERAPVSVGDRVKVQRVGASDGVVEGVAKRQNFLARPAPGREGSVIHVIAANIDVLCVVASAKTPPFSQGLVDRFFIAAEVQGIEPILCVNKIDLLEENERAGRKPWSVYSDLGYRVFEVSAKTKEGLASLHQEALLRSRVVFSGHSGVGKTSLLNALIGEGIGKVGEVSEVTGKGRHTTTSAVLLEGPEGASWVDTPGVKEFGLLGVTAENLSEFFPEFRELPCARSSEGNLCTHLEEEDCQAQNLERYESYCRILASLSEDQES